MGRALGDAEARVRVLLSVVLGLGLAVVLPALFAHGPGAGVAGVAVLALSIAALLALVSCRPHPAAGLPPVAARGAEAPLPLLPGRVTDPVHHPLRPRAPGLA